MKRAVSYIISIALCFNLIFGGIASIHAQTTTFDPIDFVSDIIKQIDGYLTSVNTTLSAWANNQGFLKEFVIDVAVKAAVNELKNMIIDDTLNWMANGFEGGGPMFVQNPGQYFKEAGDQMSGAFLGELSAQMTGNPDFFCSNFAPDLIFQFAQYRRHQGVPRCTIGAITGNLEGFIDDFQSGGWENWIQMHEYGNNPIGFELSLFDEQMRLAGERKEDVKIETNTGGGFKPIRECIEWVPAPSTEAGSQDKICKKFESKSIGKAVADELTPSISSNLDGLIAADEISEFISSTIDAAIQGAVRKGIAAAKE